MNRNLLAALMASAPADLGEYGISRYRPPWFDDAACREHPELTWFPTRGQSTDAAVAVCNGCLVRSECLEWALTLPTPLPGIYGGLSERQRRQVRQRAA